MPFTEEERAALFAEFKAEQPAPQPAPQQSRASIVGVPDVDPEAGPEFWVHLANGDVVRSYDSGSTHLPDKDGKPVLIIGRYQVGT